MNTTQVTVDLPEKLADEARDAGLLDGVEIARLLEAELERKRDIDNFFALLDQIHSDPDHITPEEIDEEIRLYREEKRRSRQQAAAKALLL